LAESRTTLCKAGGVILQLLEGLSNPNQPSSLHTRIEVKSRHLDAHQAVVGYESGVGELVLDQKKEVGEKSTPVYGRSPYSNASSVFIDERRCEVLDYDDDDDDHDNDDDGSMTVRSMVERGFWIGASWQRAWRARHRKSKVIGIYTHQGGAYICKRFFHLVGFFCSTFGSEACFFI